MAKTVEEVFVREGVPEFTFIEPPNFNSIFIDVRREGKPVIIEGQSGTGKTTCVKKILEKLDARSYMYLTARNTDHVSKIHELSKNPASGTYVIDDFHRLHKDIQKRLANIAKASAEQDIYSQELPKLILIGINEIGSALIQLVPDVAKRVGIHRIQPGSENDIQKLITQGQKALNIAISPAIDIFKESRGDYWLTQLLCLQVCLTNGILETQDDKKEINFQLDSLRKQVIPTLTSTYYPAVKEFCRGKRFRRSNDPYYKLLKSFSEQDSSIVDLNELANSDDTARGSINNLKERRLGILLESKPLCSRHFYYNDETKSFAVEDPALFYFLKHMNWDLLRKDCGFKEQDNSFEYDFAISFAGNNRDLARLISNNLEILDARVFFDENYEANYLGKAWSKEFKRIFSTDSRFVVCLLDVEHEKRIWPTFERECFTPRIPDGSVIPVYLDDTTFVGIPKDIIGIMFKAYSIDDKLQDIVIEEIVYKLIEREEAAD